MHKYLVWLYLGAALALIPVTGEGSRWSRTGDVHVGGRHGYEGALLTDGRVLIVQGAGENSYEVFDPATGTWTYAAFSPGGIHTMVVLLPNGKALFLPSFMTPMQLFDSHTDSWSASSSNISWSQRCCATLLKNKLVLLMYNGQSCHLYDCVTDALSSTASSQVKHQSGTEILLRDGRVLLVGGDGGPRACELYDPATQTWSWADSVGSDRNVHVGMLLRPPWNDVLIAGAGSSCELYDPGADSWQPTGSMNSAKRSVSSMVLLPSGKPMIIGGSMLNNTCELYDPDSATWDYTDPTEKNRSHVTATILHTGKVLVSGGFDLNVGGVVEIYDPSDGSWDTKPSLNQARAVHTTTPLPIIPTSNCSTNVLIAGGENGSGSLRSCELYNYSLDRVSATGQLLVARSHHTAVLLATGRVLVAGGKNPTVLNSSELFDVGGETWSSTAGSMTDARYDHAATLLKNGDVLVTGGESAPGSHLGSAELYSGGNWTGAGSFTTARSCHSAVVLLNGNVLVIGGKTSGGAATSSCQIWNGSTWTSAGPLSTGRYYHTATLLQSGNVLVTGGTADGSTPLSSCEVYSLSADSWSPEGSLNTARYAHNATLLYSGLILATGGNGGITSCEIWDPAAEWNSGANTHGWKVTASLPTGRAYHSSVLVTDTMPFVLAIGGNNGSYLNSIQEYDVGLGYRSMWQSTITNHPGVTKVSGSMNIEGTLFRGYSEADGGNYDHIANNDHPIISMVRIGGGNWQGNGGGGILHVPISSSWDTAHTNVDVGVSDFAGYFRLWSIVNGIPCRWYKACEPQGTEEGTQSTVHSPQPIVFPNPSTCDAGVHFRFWLSTVDHGPSTLAIYDLTGRLVRSLPIHHLPLTIHQLKPGIYFYKINCHSDPELASGLSESHTVKGKFTVVD